MPLFRRPGRDDGWTPSVAGTAKRDLLKEVLQVFGTLASISCYRNIGLTRVRIAARSKTLTKLALDWQDVLKKSANEES